MTLATITEHGRATAREATAVLNEAQFGTAPLSATELERVFAMLRRVRMDEGDF